MHWPRSFVQWSPMAHTFLLLLKMTACALQMYQESCKILAEKIADCSPNISEQ